MRTSQLDADIADRSHADEVRRARHKTCKCRGERNRSACGQAHRSSNHGLLRNEVLIEAIGKRFLERVAERRILHVGVERNHSAVDLSELDDGGSIRLTRRDLIAKLVGRWCRRLGLSSGTRSDCWLRDLSREINTGWDCFELLLELGERTIELLT